MSMLAAPVQDTSGDSPVLSVLTSVSLRVPAPVILRLILSNAIGAPAVSRV
ncbi:MAG: hypothetical protein IPG99_03365 [Ignavibacteria bacterium]|nr:hypothetical protein [Ignavibacteria bacterium]